MSRSLISLIKKTASVSLVVILFLTAGWFFLNISPVPVQSPSAAAEVTEQLDCLNEAASLEAPEDVLLPAGQEKAEDSSLAPAAVVEVGTQSVVPVSRDLYSLGAAHSRDLKVNIVVANKGNTRSKNIRVEVPLLARIDSPYQSFAGEVFSHQPVEINTGDMRNRTAVFHIDSLRAGAAETITLTYSLKVNPIISNLKGYVSDGSSSNVGYLESSPKIESSHPDIIAKAAEITADSGSDLDKARDIFRFVISYMKYDRSSPNRNRGALAALEGKSGVCEDYAALFTALCRASGIPSRQVNGYTDPEGTGDIWNISPGQTFSLSGYRHSWAEFYIEGIGWVPVDPTMNMNSDSLTYFGSLPQASHIAQNYLDQSIRARFQGGQLAISWNEQLVKY